MTNRSIQEPDVIVAGHICLDVIPTLPKGNNYREFLIPGRLLQLGPILISTGGPVSNTGLALHKLGVPTRLMAKVGDDIFGDAILKIVRKQDASLIKGIKVVAGESSSYSIILTIPDVDRIVLHYPGANDTFDAGDVDYDMVAHGRIFHFGYPPMMKRMYQSDGAELVEILRRVKQSGVLTSVDMVLPDPDTLAGQANWDRILRRALPHVDFFLPSIEEMLLMLRPELFDELSKRAGASGILSLVTPQHFLEMSEILLDMGTSIVALKGGHLGLYLRTAGAAKIPGALDALGWAERELWAPCFKTMVVGTTGSGDATIAGFLAGVLGGLGPIETMTGAVATGACNVEAADALAGIVSWPEVQKRIASGWARLPLQITASGWRYDQGRDIWVGPHDRPQ
ncbi:MAG TPA: carbohydrate kinase family protein [Acidobacteriota bacterium]|jgi:sugar/nucleoside kinase (ribokinase family)|nr:carbohydrate kinase family protein [Acidobacteriota bacterium]